MTVEELLFELSDLPSDAEVRAYSDIGGYTITGVDGANPEEIVIEIK